VDTVGGDAAVVVAVVRAVVVGAGVVGGPVVVGASVVGTVVAGIVVLVVVAGRTAVVATATFFADWPLADSHAARPHTRTGTAASNEIRDLIIF
jgi:hypothetical protein